jgi:hypothetical protein
VIRRVGKLGRENLQFAVENHFMRLPDLAPNTTGIIFIFPLFVHKFSCKLNHNNSITQVDDNVYKKRRHADEKHLTMNYNIIDEYKDFSANWKFADLSPYEHLPTFISCSFDFCLYVTSSFNN